MADKHPPLPIPRYASTRAVREYGKAAPHPKEPELPGAWDLLSTQVCHYSWTTESGYHQVHVTRHHGFEYVWTWQRVVDTVNGGENIFELIVEDAERMRRELGK